jgi:hypothetical protein
MTRRHAPRGDSRPSVRHACDPVWTASSAWAICERRSSRRRRSGFLAAPHPICRACVERRAQLPRARRAIGKLLVGSTAPEPVSQLAARARRHRSQRRDEHPVPVQRSTPVPRRVLRQLQQPALPSGRRHARSPRLVLDACPGRIWSSVSSVSKHSNNGSAENRCGSSLRLPTRRSQGASSSAWPSAQGAAGSSRRARPASQQTLGSKRLKLQASTSHRPATGLLVPDHRDERAPPIQEIQPLLSPTPKRGAGVQSGSRAHTKCPRDRTRPQAP